MHCICSGFAFVGFICKNYVSIDIQPQQQAAIATGSPLSNLHPSPAAPPPKQNKTEQSSDSPETVQSFDIQETVQSSLSSALVDQHGMVLDPSVQETDDTPLVDENNSKKRNYLESETYKPIEYGDFRSYIKNKRAKLKVQETALLEEQQVLLRLDHDRAADLEPDAQGKTSDIFKGCCIYINGQTHPPYSELRRLIVLHGGDLMAYLDQKRPCTHIVASNLTPKKRIEFKHYKVVLPGWILESIQLGKKVDWAKWKCDAITGTNGHAGTSMIAKQPPAHSSSSNPTVGEWRNVWHQPQAAKIVPHAADAQESPWGKPNNQKSILQAFSKDKPYPSSSVDFTDQYRPHHSPKSANELVPLALHPEQETQTPSPQTRSTASCRKTHPTFDTIQPDQSLQPSTPKKSKEKIGYPSVSTVGQKQLHHPYASRSSNTHAARLLASPTWREQNTATSEGFLAGYFSKSRLHHLSTWKSNLQDMVGSALREASRPSGSVSLPNGVKRTIMHIDFDCFFVSVGLIKRPDLADKPIAVCHSSGGQRLSSAAVDQNTNAAQSESHSTSEIASCNYVARQFGVRNGMSLGQASQMCPHIRTIPYDFQAYNQVSLKFYTFLLEHVDALQAVSVDEALVDVSMLLESMRTGQGPLDSLYQRYRDSTSSQGETWSEEKQLAEAFRDEIRSICGCEASIGIGSNILLARLATRRAKPAGSFRLTQEASQAYLDQLDVDDLHGIGSSLRNRLRDMFGSINIGKLRTVATEQRLIHELGPKKGKTIWEKMHGKAIDRIEGHKLRQSVGSHVNYGIRFLTNQEAEAFVDDICGQVSQRARVARLKGRQVSVQIMVRAKHAPVEASKFLGHGICDTHHRSTLINGPRGGAVDDKVRIKMAAWPLIRDLNIDPKELRGIAISLNKLEPSDGTVLSPPTAEVGQSILKFTKRTTMPKSNRADDDLENLLHQSVASENESGNEQEDEEDKGLLPDLQKGPFAATPRRPVVSNASPVIKERQNGSISSANLTPTLTPIAIPSKSQIDLDIVSALPTQFRQQIQAALDLSQKPRSTLNGEAMVNDFDAIPQTSRNCGLHHHLTPRILPRSTPTTPQKAKVAPSPAIAEALLLPSASQIDPTVLAELPESIRRDILAQAQLAHQRFSNRSEGPSSLSCSNTSTPTKSQTKSNDAGVSLFFHANQRTPTKQQHSALFRSASESPRKRPIFEKLSDLDQPRVDKVSFLLLDPSQIPDKELVTLDIDPDVFRALPIELQRESFTFQSELKKSEKARFKPGRSYVFEEVTRAERRRRDTIRAAQHEMLAQKNAEPSRKGKEKAVDSATDDEIMSHPPSFLVAKPLLRTPSTSTNIFAWNESFRPVVKVASVRGLTSTENVRNLFSQWVTAFRNFGPRKGDVSRVSKYLEQLVTGPALQLEKTCTLLAWIRHLLRNEFGNNPTVESFARQIMYSSSTTTVSGENESQPQVELDWWVCYYLIVMRIEKTIEKEWQATIQLPLD